jgi:hypothetical protein
VTDKVAMRCNPALLIAARHVLSVKGAQSSRTVFAVSFSLSLIFLFFLSHTIAVISSFFFLYDEMF